MAEEKRPQVLVVEDQINWRRLYKLWLKNSCHLTFCSTPIEALDRLGQFRFDIVIMDLGLPTPDEGIRLIRRIASMGNGSKTIVVSAFTERSLHLEVQKLGVYALFNKDERLESELPIIVRKAYEMVVLEQENVYLRQQFREKEADYQIIGVSPFAEQLRQKAESLSQADTPVLITGPTGVGKNHFAKQLHFLSPRREKPFVAINCANLSPHLVESELFGHVRGAFTGAETAKQGKFEIADGGTVLLDEIGELPLAMQAKLLQVIEEKSFFPLGSDLEKKVDVRILASTNRDLREEMQRGNFREDLYYRLTGFNIHILPLASRPEDIPLFFDHLLDKICEDESLPRPEVAPEVYQLIQQLPWRGNVREMKNVITRLLLFHPRQITAQDLLENLSSPGENLMEKAIQKRYSLKEMAALYAQELYRQLNNKSAVARILEVDIKTVNRYLNLKID